VLAAGFLIWPTILTSLAHFEALTFSHSRVSRPPAANAGRYRYDAPEIEAAPAYQHKQMLLWASKCHAYSSGRTQGIYTRSLIGRGILVCMAIKEPERVLPLSPTLDWRGE
jgi:hypothetical protein